jgi:CheY-like chemotaxis protein
LVAILCTDHGAAIAAGDPLTQNLKSAAGPSNFPLALNPRHGYNSLMTGRQAERDTQARILVVDDEPYTLDLIKLTLTTDGLYVKTASSGDEALHLIKMESFDLILLDIMMPEISGFDVMERLHADATKIPPIILLTALSTKRNKETGKRLGAVNYIVKPVARGALLDAVYEALGNSPHEHPSD